MDYISVAVPSWLDLATVIVGALAGIIVARERHLDLVGFVGLGLLGGLGGGLIRDVMMQHGGVYMLYSPYAIPAAVLTALVIFLFPRTLEVSGTSSWVIFRASSNGATCTHFAQSQDPHRIGQA